MIAAPALIHPPHDSERRRFCRRPAEGTLTATFSDWQGRAGVAPLQLEDSSLTGVGVLSPVELTPGMTVTLCGADGRVPARTGVVVRCRRTAEAWSVGLSFSRRAAA